MITTQELLDSIARRCAAAPLGEVLVFWASIDGDREVMRSSILALETQIGVVPIVVREVRFDDPNNLAADFVALLEKNRVLIEPRVAALAKRAVFALLARGEMGIADSSSPALLPSWFGSLAGTSPLIQFRDITWEVEASLASEHARQDGIAECLFELERASVAALVLRWKREPLAMSKFEALLRRETDHFGDFGEMLRHFDYARNLVTSAPHFRPSIRDGDFLIARLWGVTLGIAPAKLEAAGLELCGVLSGLGSAGDARRVESLASVLGRLPPTSSTTHGRMGRAYLLTVLAACQFLTAGAHADDYPLFPVQLLRSFSFDLRRSLDGFAKLVRR